MSLDNFKRSMKVKSEDRSQSHSKAVDGKESGGAVAAVP